MSVSPVDVVEVVLASEGGHLGIPAGYVREVIRLPEKVDQVAVNEPSIRGVFAYQGSSLPIVDLAQAIGRSQESGACSRLVVVEWNGRRLAFAVDKALQMRHLPQDRVLEKLKDRGFWRGYTKLESGVDLHILDVEGLILDLEQRP